MWNKFNQNNMEIINSNQAPQAIGPYSQAIKINNLVFCSGQIPLTPSGELASENISEQAHQVLKNMQAVLEKAGTNLNKVLKTTIFLTDMNDFQTVNEIYSSYFSDHKPARSTVEVSRLPKNVKIEIECIAQI
jgi:2-iminobutanoate/2-iminopropanoate deaminase